MNDRESLVSQIQTGLDALFELLREYYGALQTPSGILSDLQNIGRRVGKTDLKPDEVDEWKRTLQNLRGTMNRAKEALARLIQLAPSHPQSTQRWQAAMEKVNEIDSNLTSLEQLMDSLKNTLLEEQQQQQHQQQQPPIPAQQPTPKQQTTIGQIIECTAILYYLVEETKELLDEFPEKLEETANFLKKYGLVRQKMEAEALPKLEKYIGENFSYENAEGFLQKVYQRLSQEIEKMREGSFDPQKAPLPIETAITLDEAEDLIEEITEVDIKQAATALEAGMNIVKQLRNFRDQLRQLGKRGLLQRLMEMAPRKFLEILFGVQTPDPTIEKLVENFRTSVEQAISEGSQKVKGALATPKPERSVRFRVLAPSRRKEFREKIRQETKKLSYIKQSTVLRAVREGLNNLLGFLSSLPPLVENMPPETSIEDIKPEWFGKLKNVVAKWKAFGTDLKGAAERYSRYLRAPSPHGLMGEKEKLRELGIPRALEGFISATNELIAEYQKLGDDEKTRFANFQKVFSELPTLQTLLTKLLGTQRAAKSFVRLDRLLPFSLDDLKRQRWLIEEKHTL